jgi:hypothetical protein
MADIVLQTVDLDVFGGPSSLQVEVDFGQTGQRGSRIFAGFLGPTIDLVGEEVLRYDWYINNTTGRMFQYTIQPGGNILTWVEAVNLVLSQYSVISTTSFTAGATTINIPTNQLTTDSGTVPDDYVVRYSIEGSNPISSAFTYAIVGSNIAITINAIEYSGGSWSNLSGNKDVHLFITYTGT